MNCILPTDLTKSLLRCNKKKMSSQVRDQQSATKFLTGMASRHVVLRQNALSFHTNLHPSSYLPEVAALLVNCFTTPYKFDWEVSGSVNGAIFQTSEARTVRFSRFRFQYACIQLLTRTSCSFHELGHLSATTLARSFLRPLNGGPGTQKGQCQLLVSIFKHAS